MNFAYDIVVTVTGVVLVFFILVLLMLIIMVEGKVFDLLNAKKKAKVEAAHAQAAGKPAKATPAAAAQPAAPDVEEGIPGDVVAAIVAAIAAMGGGKYTLRAVRRAGHAGGRGVWGKAGTSDTTAPF
jgi:sodium pump decarboxylase gamma subunit